MMKFLFPPQQQLLVLQHCNLMLNSLYFKQVRKHVYHVTYGSYDSDLITYPENNHELFRSHQLTYVF